MKLTLLCLFSGLALTTEGLAQRLSPSVLSANGGSARTATMVLDWTVGEAVAGTDRTSAHLYTQGFHQPLLLISEQQNLTSLDAEYRFTVAPNPVVAWLTVTTAFPKPMPLYLTLTDLKGHRHNLPVIPASTSSSQIDMTAYPAGTYLLRIASEKGEPLKTYKVIKTQ